MYQYKKKQIFFKNIYDFYVIVLQQQNNRLSALSLSYDVSFHITGNQTQVSQSEGTLNIFCYKNENNNKKNSDMTLKNILPLTNMSQ